MHLVDNEINCSVYIKTILAQPRSTVLKSDGSLWIKSFGTKKINIPNYLMIFRLIREMVYDLLIDEDESTFSKDYLVLPYNGKLINLTILECLEAFINHVKYHMEYIERNICEYQKK